MGLGFIPQRVPPGCERPLPGAPGARTQPRTQSASSLSHRRCAGILGGREGDTKVPGKCPPFPAEVELPHGCVFLAPRPVAHCSPALLSRTGELFPLQRKPGGVTAGPSAVPPSPQDGRHGGEARPGGIPHLSCERGAAAFPRTPPAVGAVLARGRDAPQGCPGCVRAPSAPVHAPVCGTARTPPGW